MQEFYLIHLTDSNRQAFETLTKDYIDHNDCIKLVEPSDDDAVDRFIRNNTGVFLKPIYSATTQLSTRHLFSINSNIKIEDINPSNNAEFINQAHAMIVADITGGRLIIGMDPRHEVAVLFRASNTVPWSIAKTAIIPKLSYINDLLKHPPIEGLHAQLGIHTYKNGDKETKVLMRYYKFDPPHGVQVAPMYILHPPTNGRGSVVQRGFVPEDFFRDYFRPELKLGDIHPEYGRLESIEALTPGSDAQAILRDTNKCEIFVQNQNHFVVYKTDKTAQNKNISGIFLQTNPAGHIVIQNDDGTAIDRMLNWAVQHYNNKSKPTISTSSNAKPDIQQWQNIKAKYTLNIINNIQTTSEGVRVNFTDTDYIIDTGTKLTLHGNPQEDYLKAMVLHAKENWGGKFKIDNASDSDKETLIRLAQAHGVRIIGLPISQPTRPLRNPAPPRQAARAVV